MTDADRALFREIRTVLLHLHKTLLDWQRAEYEQDHGPMATSELLQLILNHEAFAWLRSMSGLIVQIDEALAAKPPEVPAAGPMIGRARRLVAPSSGSAYVERYHAALQELPEAVLAHSRLVTLLKLHNPSATA